MKISQRKEGTTTESAFSQSLAKYSPTSQRTCPPCSDAEVTRVPESVHLPTPCLEGA